MPSKPLRPCSQPGCPEVATQGSRCPAHAQEHEQARRKRYDERRASPSARGYDAKWRRIRAQFLKSFPQCERCGDQATVVDHITPLAQGGTHQWANLQPLCASCHNRKTATEDGGGWKRQGEG